MKIALTTYNGRKELIIGYGTDDEKVMKVATARLTAQLDGWMLGDAVRNIVLVTPEELSKHGMSLTQGGLNFGDPTFFSTAMQAQIYRDLKIKSVNREAITVENRFNFLPLLNSDGRI